MAVDSSDRLRRVCLGMLKPIAGILLRCGIGAREAIELLKAAYVMTATERLGRREAPASISHVSRATQLSRREVSRLRSDYADFGNRPPLEPMREAVILSHWHTDTEYLDVAGNPIDISADGPDVSIRSLTEKYLPDSDWTFLLQQLVDHGYVERQADGRYRPLKRNFSHRRGIEAAATAFEHGIQCLARTVLHNLEADDGETWIQRNVMVEEIHRDDVPFARRAIRDRATEFVFGIDDLLAASCRTHPGSGGDRTGAMTVGLGVFYYEIDQG